MRETNFAAFPHLPEEDKVPSRSRKLNLTSRRSQNVPTRPGSSPEPRKAKCFVRCRPKSTISRKKTADSVVTSKRLQLSTVLYTILHNKPTFYSFSVLLSSQFFPFPTIFAGIPSPIAPQRFNQLRENDFATLPLGLRRARTIAPSFRVRLTRSIFAACCLTVRWR